ncbi:MAG TPA: hypothetical protein G4O16_00480 [Dehalococcoidia bacterium]|nr:hypothetical protein [Dehalococcoidia bacterium]
MRFVRHRLCKMSFCYAASHIDCDGRTNILFAPDTPGPCYSFDSETFRQETVWEEPGGTMAMVPLPFGNGNFLAVQRFYPSFQAHEAEIVYVHRQHQEWKVDPFLKLPYVHRFDILQSSGVYYLLCSTLCTTKKNRDDWSSPGGLYAVELTEEITRPIILTQIAGGMTRNHGYRRVKNGDDIWALTSCDEGVFEVLPPAKRGGNWTVNNILDRPVSDIAVCDIDGDGVDEMATIEPFHGNTFTVYRKKASGYLPLYRYPGNSVFCHTVWGGHLRNETVFIGGYRAGNRELFLLRWKDGEIVADTLETHSGPSNVDVIHGEKRDLLVVANREVGEGVVFSVTDD